MSQNGGKVCQCLLIFLSLTLPLVGLASFSYGLWLKDNVEKQDTADPNGFLFPMLVWTLIVQGSVMPFMGLYRLWSIQKNKIIGLNLFAFLLAILAVADIVIGMTFYIQCTKNCPGYITYFPGKAQFVLGMFLGAAGLLTAVLVCHVLVTTKSQHCQCR